MKRQIRQGVFETNSSSTHSMTLCMKADYDAWQEGKMLYKEYGAKNFLPVDEARKENVRNFKDYDEVSEEDIKLYLEGKKSLSDLGLEDIEEFYHTAEEDDMIWKDRYLEDFAESFTTPNGEEVFAFGWYGREG